MRTFYRNLFLSGALASMVICLGLMDRANEQAKIPPVDSCLLDRLLRDCRRKPSMINMKCELNAYNQATIPRHTFKTTCLEDQ